MSGPADIPPGPERSEPEADTLAQAIATDGALGGIGPGARIGPYVLLSILGEGGFGVVYLAERREPMIQRVALKVIKPGMDSRAVVARFEQERQALALMDHPNVAKVFDGGVTSPALGSRPYFVMEHVQGEPITAYCDRHTLTIRERIELFIPICEAVQHAHHKGIIHRDLKPSNILVSVRDGRGIPKVIDFGVAKAIGHERGGGHTIFTEMGAIIGTPEYMSPEQAEMSALDVDTRTDVYSLGVVLYELLTGTLPFDPATLRSGSSAEIQRIIREQEPPRPSTRFTGATPDTRERAVRRQSQGELLARELRRELEWIPLKAIRKDRTRRYDTPLELSRDIQRYLEGRALLAGPESAAYRLRKFFGRNRVPVAASALILLVLAVSLVSTSIALLRARHDRDAKAAALHGEELAALDAIKNRDRAVEKAKFAEEQTRRARQERVKGEKVDELLASLLSLAVRSDTAAPGAAGARRPILDALWRAAAGLDAGELRGFPAAEARLRLVIGRFLAESVAASGPDAAGVLSVERVVAPAADLARDEGDEPTQAEAIEELASLAEARGDLPLAGQRLAQAANIRRKTCPIVPIAPGDDASVGSNDAIRKTIIASLARSAGVELRDQFDRRAKTPLEDDRFRSMGDGDVARREAAAGNYARAVTLQSDVLGVERSHHPEHPRVVQAMRTLARYLRGRGSDGDQTEAASLETEADEIAKILRQRRLALADVLGHHARVLEALHSDDLALAERAEAVQTCESVVVECRRQFGIPTQEEAIAQLRMGAILIADNKASEAQLVIISAVRTLEPKGSTPPTITDALSRAAAILEARGQVAEAARCRAGAPTPDASP